MKSSAKFWAAGIAAALLGAAAVAQTPPAADAWPMPDAAKLYEPESRRWRHSPLTSAPCRLIRRGVSVKS